MLIKYQHLTKGPGKYTELEYELKILVEGSIPTSTNWRPIPYDFRYQVREQIQVILKDDSSKPSRLPPEMTS